MDKPSNGNPRENASVLSLLFMSWMYKILSLGRKRGLIGDDLYSLMDKNKAKNIIDGMESCWSDEMQRAAKKRTKPKLWRALLHYVSYKAIFVMVTVKVFHSCCNYGFVIIVWYFLKLLSESKVDIVTAIPYVAGLSIISFVKVIPYHHMSFHANVTGLRAKVAFIGLIYKKILSARRCRLAKFTTGHIINLVANDTTAIERGLYENLSYATASPLEFVAGVTLLWWLFGWKGLVGAVYFVFVGIFNLSMSKKFGSLHSKAALVTDRRLAIINNIICGIRAVKMYAWEWNFRDLVKSIRRKEIKIFRIRSVIYTVIASSFLTATPVALFITVATLLYTGVPLTSFSVFTMLVLLTLLRTTICVNATVQVLHLMDALASLKRIEDILTFSAETDPTEKSERETDKALDDIETIEFKPKKTGKNYGLDGFDNPSENKVVLLQSSELTSRYETPSETLSMENAFAMWDTQRGDCSLQGISLEITPEQLTIVTGPVGSGKTSLLLAFLGELSLRSGVVKGQGTIAYASQIPWIFSGTIRENILFGSPFDPEKYEQVLQVCDLETDLKLFAKGDMSFIGHRGVCLSGGQRARVSLARALYYDADVYLLDDPLSAVDAKVGSHLFEKCICGVLCKKKRLLVTHQLQFLPKADKIVVMKDGRIEFKGSYDELWSAELQFCDMKMHNEKTNDIATSHGRNLTGGASKFDDDSLQMELEDDGEECAVGSISWKVYWSFLRAGLSLFAAILLCCLFVVSQASQIAPSWWLSQMVNMSYEDQKSTFSFAVLSGMIAVAVVLSVSSFFFLLLGSLQSSANLHDRMILAIIKSPVLFMDLNPVGRIMNRFSKDTRCIEHFMPRVLLITIVHALQFVGGMILTASVEYRFVIAVVPISLLFCFICWFTLKSCRELKRLESARCSPIYAHIADSIKGLEAIHAAKMEKEFVNQLCRFLNDHTQAFYLDKSCRTFLGLHLESICALFVTCVAVGSLLVTQNPGITGLLIAYSFELMDLSWYGVASYSEAENYMTSAERVIEYTQLPPEPAYSRQSQPPDNWPDKGDITIQDMSLSYIHGGKPVLKNINLKVLPKQKVGIVGRTGAGKSSLVAALFRMPDPQGKVLIDGVDLGEIDIQSARRSMAVITQDPVLFASTLRKNLDPFEQFSDEQIWAALDEVQLKNTIQNIKGGLSFTIGESGSSLSVGERQLVCLARALLLRNKVLIMDEATANVDFKTDQLIQEAIRSKFQDCTVITIAHRLNTIMDYDKVLVMEEGHVVEYDSPQVLANKVAGVFAELLKTQSAR